MTDMLKFQRPIIVLISLTLAGCAGDVQRGRFSSDDHDTSLIGNYADAITSQVKTTQLVTNDTLEDAKGKPPACGTAQRSYALIRC